MNVLEVTGEPILHGGQEKFIANLVENMNDSKIKMDVLTPYQIDNENFCELIRSRGGDVYTLGLKFEPGKSRKALIKTVGQFINKKKYDVVHVHSGSISVLAYVAYAAKRAGVGKVLVHAHNTGVPSLKHSLVKKYHSRRLLKNVDYYLACSFDAGATKYPKSVLDNNRLILINNGINTSVFCRNQQKRLKIRTQLGLTDEDYVIGHVGRFSEEKNHEYLLKVFNEIYKMEQNAYLLLIGDGEKRKEIEAQRMAVVNPDHIIITGNVDDVQDFYQAMDVFLLPSLHEGLPFVLVEAQAAGLPCIMSTGVSDEAVLCEKVKRIPLSDFNAWVRTTLTFMNSESVDNTESIKAAGYDIGNTVQQIRALYYR